MCKKTSALLLITMVFIVISLLSALTPVLLISIRMGIWIFS